MEFCTGIASGSYRCFFSLRCLATSVCASSCGSFFLSSCFPASGCLRVLSPDSSLLPSSSLTWPVSSAPGWGSPPLVSVFPCYLRCSAWRSIGSLRLCLSTVSAFWGSLFPCSLLPVAPGFSAAYFLPPFLRCSSCLRCGSLWLCLSAVQALLGFLFPCSLLQGFSAASSLPPFCAAPVASAADLSAFPQLRLAPSLISLALLLCLAVLRLMLRCLGLLRLLPSSSLSVWLGSSCPLVGVCGSGRYRCCGSGY